MRSLCLSEVLAWLLLWALVTALGLGTLLLGFSHTSLSSLSLTPSRQGHTIYPRLVLYSLHSLGWLLTFGPPASTFPVLVCQACATTPSFLASLVLYGTPVHSLRSHIHGFWRL